MAVFGMALHDGFLRFRQGAVVIEDGGGNEQLANIVHLSRHKRIFLRYVRYGITDDCRHDADTASVAIQSHSASGRDKSDLVAMVMAAGFCAGDDGENV